MVNQRAGWARVARKGARSSAQRQVARGIASGYYKTKSQAKSAIRALGGLHGSFYGRRGRRRDAHGRFA